MKFDLKWGDKLSAEYNAEKDVFTFEAEGNLLMEVSNASVHLPQDEPRKLTINNPMKRQFAPANHTNVLVVSRHYQEGEVQTEVVFVDLNKIIAAQAAETA